MISRYRISIVNLLDTHTVCQSCYMDTPAPSNRYKNHRFPVEIISHAVWLYFRFCLSFRDGCLSKEGLRLSDKAPSPVKTDG
jgi:hypothetical protein